MEPVVDLRNTAQKDDPKTSGHSSVPKDLSKTKVLSFERPPSLSSQARETQRTESSQTKIIPFPVKQAIVHESEVERESLILDADQAVLSEALEEEEMVANELALEQRIQELKGQLERVVLEGNQYGHGVSTVKILILLGLGIPNDVLDIMEFSGLLIPLSMALSAILSLTSIMICWLTGSRYKNARSYAENALAAVEKVSQEIAHISRQTIRMARWASKLTGTNMDRFILKSMARTRRFLRKSRNPLAKFILGNVLDVIPFLGIMPWATLSVLLLYIDERGTFKEAHQTAQGIKEELAEAA